MTRELQIEHYSPMASGVGELHRTEYIWWVYAAFWGFIVLLTGGAALNPDVPIAGRVACGLIASGVAAFLVRARRAGIETAPDHVLVREYSGRSKRVDWSDVDSFAAAATGGFNRSVYIAVRLKDGRLLKTQGLVAPSPESKSAKRWVARLEARRPR